MLAQQTKGWSTYSVKLPAQLAMRFPNELHVMPSARAFHPSWYERDLMSLFAGGSAGFDLSDYYAIHLYEVGLI